MASTGFLPRMRTTLRQKTSSPIPRPEELHKTRPWRAEDVSPTQSSAHSPDFFIFSQVLSPKAAQKITHAPPPFRGRRPSSTPISSTVRPVVGRGALRRPSFRAAKLSEISINSSKSWEMHTTAVPLAARSRMACRIAAAAAASTPPCRLVHHQHRRVLKHLTSDYEFLQITAGQGPRRVFRTRCPDVENLDDLFGKALGFGPFQKAVAFQTLAN